MPLTGTQLDRFEAAMPRLHAIAYRMLGSAGDAEDAVQDTFLRWQAADIDAIEVPEAWLTTVLTNLCRNHLTSARVRREAYVGQWLPEPLLAGDPMLGPAETAEQRESLSYAVLALMERLSPDERAVYVLREAFDHSHREIAGVLGVSESASQQLLHRARKRIAAGRPRAEVEPATARAVVEEFMAATADGSTERLLRLLTDDAFSVGDGGGRVPARTAPFAGAAAVARFVRGLFTPGKAKRDLVGGTAEVHLAEANGSPAVVVAVDGRVVGVMCPEVTADGITALRNQVNPEKLRRATRQWARSERGEPLFRAF
ncbi:RNA polymerase sigma-70 factor [Streptomyces lonarensis]|uniref:RNA polymerase sigma-70 factor n=1 Tax=Streptomyces lonarensis TaxID=700599 RepID=A0A7X6D3H6_9ACTN|nr:RNA polymerase sigma-70 factor [Streptomyces lonarensis]NJQ07343.1 RNA polymerase sigma-70 factor [Streptomyces lonarensis]